MIDGNQGQNVYPDPDNYPDSTFPQPVPAPDVDPDAGALITVQYAWEWQQVLLACIDQLRNPATWQGTHDEIITALNRATNLKDMLQIDIGSSDIDAPYWDDAEDVGSEMPPDEQPWYGQVLDPALPPNETTFIENAIIVTFAGLLAIVTPELGFAPAIAFLTIAPKMVLAVRNQDFGRIIRIFIDGAETYSFTDDGSGDITSVPVLGDPDLETHQIYITSGEA